MNRTRDHETKKANAEDGGGGQDIVQSIERRLPAGDFVSPAEVATAFNVSVSTVYAWMDDDSIQVINLGAGEKRYFRVLRKSVIEFARRRSGIGN